jgi:hypothetical protein
MLLICRGREIVFDSVRSDIAGLYGALEIQGEEKDQRMPPGPLSYKQYIEYIMKKGDLEQLWNCLQAACKMSTSQ